MTTLQWALLLLGAGIALALILSNRREKKQLERSVSNALRSRGGVGHDWNSAAVDAASGGASGSFDEFGVSRPRKRSAPEIGNGAPGKSAAEPGEKNKAKAPPEKVVALYIAEHEGTSILGPKIHTALKAQGLVYGAHRIYHKVKNGDAPLYSVASLVKPGELNPAEAADFSTPGLSVFMQLPGPTQPQAALQDMLDTARALAQALNAELFDAERREPLTAERERALQAQVQEWVKQSKSG